MLLCRRFLSAVVCLIVLFSAGAASAGEGMSKRARQNALRAAYDAFHADASFRALEKRANANLADGAAVDALLKKMPLSPLEHLQIDMQVRHYEVFIPQYI